jgi:hypothetical protein
LDGIYRRASESGGEEERRRGDRWLYSTELKTAI